MGFNKEIQLFEGLPFMLHEKVFDDAFILHNQTNVYPFLQKMLLFDEDENEEFGDIMISASEQSTDDRKKLHTEWASPKKFFRFQPLDLIRNYFGEAFALYFAWLGVFNITLIFPMIVGIIFFAIGIANR